MIEFTLGLLADNAYLDQVGKLFVLGEFGAINAVSAPVTHQQCSAVARWTASALDVEGNEPFFEVEVVDEDGKAITPRSPKIPLKFAPHPSKRGRWQAQALLQLQALQIPRFGAYSIHFRINGASNGEIPFDLVKAPAKNG